MHLTISDGFASSKTYDKRDDFDFDIVNFPFLKGIFLELHLTGFIYHSLFGLLECLVMYTRNQILTAKHLKQGYRYHKLRKTFSKFYRRHYDLV